MWLLLVLFFIVFFAMPVGYGWGYRRWGPPYPTFFRRRRARPLDDETAVVGNNPEAGWGWIADLVWIALAIGLISLVLAVIL